MKNSDLEARLQLVDGFNEQAVPNRNQFATPGSETAVRYQPSGSYEIRRIEIWTGKLDAKRVDIYFSIREDAQAKPGTRLAPEAMVSVDSPPEGWYGASFPEPIPVTQERIYWITYTAIIEGGPAVHLMPKPDGTVEAVPVPVPGRTYRSPHASTQPGDNPDLEETTYFWSYDGVDWRGPSSGHHMIRIYA